MKSSSALPIFPFQSEASMNKFSGKALAVTGILSAILASVATIGGSSVALSRQGYTIAKTDSYSVDATIEGTPLSVQCETIRLTSAGNQVLIIRGFGNRNNTGYGVNAVVNYFTTPEREAWLYNRATAGYMAYHGYSSPWDAGKEVRDACINNYGALAQHTVKLM